MLRRIILVIASVVLLSMPWLGFQGWTLLVAFVPLFILQTDIYEHRKTLHTKARFMPWVVLTFFLWQLITTFWIKNATLGGMIAAVLINTMLTSFSFWIYHMVWLKARKALAYTIFASFWIFYEYMYLHGEISWPWLTLGFGFANTPYAVQWYEYTGALGGSLWILISNLLFFKAWERYYKTPKRSHWVTPTLFIVAPVVFSVYTYMNYTEDISRSIRVQVIQPNIDPYNEKFGGLTQQQQTDIILHLADSAPKGTNYIVAPETAIDDRIWENEINTDESIAEIRQFLRERKSGAEFIVGATTRYRFASDQTPTPTARYADAMDFYYDTYNTALQIDTTEAVGIYHKSQLVIGVEKMPYPKLMKSLEKHFVDLGGTYGQLGTQPDREVFESMHGTKVGVAVCYESIYGQYLSGFVRNGAEALFIITNDGWWKQTPGYKQHFSYARLRAIETRRSIARSANTGISGFINQRGDVISSSKWNEATALTADINLNQKITFYTRSGDYLGRIAMYVTALCLLYFVAYSYRKINHFVE